MNSKHNFEDLLNIIKVLRSENGCPWDKVQTHETLKEAMLEEAYEVVEAINKKDTKNLCEELGDVLLQIVLHCQIEKEKNQFDITDVIDGISKKMIHRHPHIFADTKAENEQEVLQNWEEIKKKEKAFQTQTEVLKAVPDALPALIKASKIQKKASDLKFDFENVYDALQKVKEEIKELEMELNEENGNIEEEFGDILFSMVNISRFLKINPEFALTKSMKKFINRFEYVEKSALLKGKKLSELPPEQLDSIWEEAKEKENL